MRPRILIAGLALALMSFATLGAFAQATKKNEPSGVVANTLPPPEKYEEVVQAIDVAAPYLYPVPYQPIRSVGDAVGRASAASQGKKPLLPILQIFTWTPTDRYPTAQHFADDLRRYLDGRPIAARPIGPASLRSRQPVRRTRRGRAD